MLALFRRGGSARWYVPAVFAAWVFAPEVRRVIDYQSAFHALSLISIVPLLVLLPGALFLKTGWASLGTTYRSVVILWGFGFGYAFLMAGLNGGLFPAMYEGALFGLPILLGFLLMARSTAGMQLDYERTANVILVIGIVSSLYGIAQYISPTPWDVYWSRNANITSQGDTVAFSFRIFGTLNSTGIFADYLAFATVVNLPRLRVSRWWLSVMLSPCLIALMLTSVRALWVSLAVALVVYLVLAPKRLALVGSLGSIAAVACLVGAVVIFAVGGAEQAITTISQRFETFTDLNSDASGQIRGNEVRQALREGIEEPLGAGLGVYGTAAKLSDQNTTNGIDSGYLARFVEMGFVGSAFYLLAIGAASVMTFSAYKRYVAAGNANGAGLIAMALAIQIGLVVADIFSDHHNFLAALFFWYALYFASAYAAPAGVRRDVAQEGQVAAPFGRRLGLTA